MRLNDDFSFDEEPANFVDDVSYSGGLGGIIFGCNYNEDSCQQQVRPVPDPCKVRSSESLCIKEPNNGHPIGVISYLGVCFSVYKLLGLYRRYARVFLETVTAVYNLFIINSTSCLAMVMTANC